MNSGCSLLPWYSELAENVWKVKKEKGMGTGEGFGIFVRACISTLWGELRWNLEHQKSWMENISCLIPGNETIQASSSQDFSYPPLFVCTNIQMKTLNVWKRWMDILFDPLSWKYAEQCWLYGENIEGKKVNSARIWHYTYAKSTHWIPHTVQKRRTYTGELMSQELYNRIIICAALQVTSPGTGQRISSSDLSKSVKKTVGIGQGLACLNTKSAKSEDIVLIYFKQFLWPWNRLEDMLDKKNGIRSRKWN